jgi:hypothetical protein
MQPRAADMDRVEGMAVPILKIEAARLIEITGSGS